MRKWTITVLVVAALAASGFYAHAWLPKALPFLRNHENADLLKSISSIVQISLWIVGGLTFIVRLWHPKKKADDPPMPAALRVRTQSGGVNVTGGELKVNGDFAGGDRVEGDTVAGDKFAGDKISGNKYVLPAPPVVNALHQLPTPPADFTGRADELKELLQAVKIGGVTISGLHGLGGVGKTALALKLAERLKADYPDAQFYLDLKGVSPQPLTPRDAMAYIVRAWHPTAQLLESQDEVRGLYLSVLHEKRALLLMDNARDAQQVAPLIPPAGCLMLVTSRKHFALPGLFEKNLDKLPPDDARELLLRIAPRLKNETTEQVDELSRLCGYLPLALRAVASAFHEKKNISPTDYANRLADTRQRLKLTETDAALRSSYALLSDDLQQKFRFLSVFPDTFDLAAASATWDIPPEAAQDSLSQLLNYSLVEFDETTNRYGPHDLVRLFAGQLLSSEERNTSQKRHAGHYLQVLKAANGLYIKGGDSVTKGLALFDMEWTNIHAGQVWTAAHEKYDDAVAAWCFSYPNAGLSCLPLRQHPRDHISWLEKALDVARRLQRRKWEGAALGNLGIIYKDLGDYRRAIDLHEQSLEIARVNGDRLVEGNALGNLGIVYHHLGDHRRAIQYHEQRMQIARRIGDQRGECAALANLGNAYDSLGEHVHAIEYQEQHLKIARELGDRLGESKALGNLGNAYYGLHEYVRAIEHHEQQLKIAREIGTRRGEGHALGNIGIAYFGVKLYRRALEFHEQSLRIKREIGDRHGEANALWNSALAFEQLGDRAAAVAHAEAALKIFEAIESPYASRVRDQLAKWREEDKPSGQGSAE